MVFSELKTEEGESSEAEGGGAHEQQQRPQQN